MTFRLWWCFNCICAPPKQVKSTLPCKWGYSTLCQILSISISDRTHQVNLTRIGTTQDPPDWPQPSHLKHWLKETATFLEIYNREASLTKLLRNEKASLMAERDQLVEALQKREERHKLALRLLCQEKDNVTKELQERLRKMGERLKRFGTNIDSVE